jgi:hypothetical protein
MDVDDHINNCDEDIENNSINIQDTPGPLGNKGPISINDISLMHFREMLVEHFNVLFHNNKIVWPRRLLEKPRYVPA